MFYINDNEYLNIFEVPRKIFKELSSYDKDKWQKFLDNFHLTQNLSSANNLHLIKITSNVQKSESVILFPSVAVLIKFKTKSNMRKWETTIAFV